MAALAAMAGAAYGDEAASAPAEPVKVEAPAELKAAVGKGIELLEGEKFQEFLETFADPKTVAKMKKEDGGMEKAVEKFKRRKAGVLLTTLKAAKEQKVVLTKEGRMAMYPASGDEVRELRWVNVEGRWYIAS